MVPVDRLNHGERYKIGSVPAEPTPADADPGAMETIDAGGSALRETLPESHGSETALQKGLLALVAASGSLLKSPRLEDVLPATLRLAKVLVPADGYAVWRLDGASHTWRIGASEGVSSAFVAEMIPSYRGHPVGAVDFTDPIASDDVLAVRMLDERREAYAREGIRSIIAVPLTIQGQGSGTLVCYYRAPHHFTEVEIHIARALGNLAAAAVTTAELYEEQYRSHARATFLAEAGAALATSLDVAATLKTVATLAVPRIADWCAVDILNPHGRLERLAVAHVDPAKVEYARTLQERYPDDPESPTSVTKVALTGQPLLVPNIPDDLMVAAARDQDHLRALRALDLTSYICVPLMVRGKAFGALTFVAAESGRHYTETDLHFAQDVAARASLAVENARAYQQVYEANRLKDDFLGTLSHELRTPLNAVLGYARMLRSGVMSADKQTRAVEVIERNARALNQMVDDVLDVSRIVSGKLRLDVQSVELPLVLQEAVTTVRPAADAKGVRLQTVIDPLALPVSGDPDRLQQVMWNLLSNAVKFTPRGGRVQIRLERINSHVEIVVSDTGVGIKTEFLPHVFERFRQGESHFARAHGGLGLGLAIARQIVEMHGGTIHASSEGDGAGATFRVALPLMIADRQHDGDPLRVHPRTERRLLNLSSGPRLEGISILAVDDDADASGLLRAILEAAGATVITVGSGAMALNSLDGHVPDILISDIGMPGMDGLQLIRAVRARSGAAAKIAAVALTAYARSEDRINALNSGFQMHVPKPVDPLELIVTVATLARRDDSEGV